jgi:uncharacterized membrane protein (UPF0127 family)
MPKLKIETAKNPTELAKGLMYRQELAQDSGMLFKFQSPMPISMWGKNTFIPLDVAFVDRNNVITEIRSIAPMSTRLITSQCVCAYAIEANAGYFETNGIGPGTKVSVNQDETEIDFNA